jgi:hypothetical protein
VKLRPLLPAVAGLVALVATTAAYRLALRTDPPPPPRADADGCPVDPVIEARFIRSVARELVAQEVIAGRWSVPEAAAVFGWLDARPPRTVAAFPDQIAALAGLSDTGGYTDAELQGVRVVALAALMARSDSPSPPGSVERVRREFLAARARGEFARLPAPPECEGQRLVERARTESRGYSSGRPASRGARSAQ